MKKKNIKKRLAALRSGLMLSLFVISPFSIFKADNDATPTTYGSYSTNQYYNGNTNGITGAKSEYPLTVLTYSLNGTYNGRFTIYWKYWRSGTAYSDTLQAIELIIPINCYVESISDSSCTIAFKNQSEIAILLQSKAINDEIEITGISNYNMTKITDGTATQLQHLSNMIDQLYTNSGTVLTRLNTLISQTDGVETGLTNINTNVQSILTEIQNYFTDSNGTTINIGDIILQFNEFNAQLQLQLGILNDLKSALLDIDNKIDTITWTNHTTQYYQASTSYSSGWSNISNGTNYGKDFYISLPSTWFNSTNRIYHLRIPLSINASNNSQISINLIDQNGINIDTFIKYYVRTSQFIDVYVTTEFIASLSYRLHIVSNDNVTGLTISSTNAYYEYIDSTDIEYWDIYNIIQNYNYRITLLNKLNDLTPINYNSKLDDIIDAINDIEINYNINTDIETEINNSLEAINDIDVVIQNNVEVFTDNKDSVLSTLTYFENTLITRMDNVTNFLYDHIFVGQFRTLYQTFLWYMLFGVLIVVILG